jgi:hypothetical protein
MPANQESSFSEPAIPQRQTPAQRQTPIAQRPQRQTQRPPIATSDTHRFAQRQTPIGSHRNVRHPSVRAQRPQRQTPIGSCASSRQRSRASRPPPVRPTTVVAACLLAGSCTTQCGIFEATYLTRLPRLVFLSITVIVNRYHPRTISVGDAHACLCPPRYCR